MIAVEKYSDLESTLWVTYTANRCTICTWLKSEDLGQSFSNDIPPGPSWYLKHG